MNKQVKIETQDAENIHVALVRAQAEMSPLIKGEVNKHFGNRYADLSAVVEACRRPLNDNGIYFHHELRRVDGEKDMVTILTHAATQTSIECAVPLVVEKSNMQGMKSATTYAKRIGLESVTGLAPEDDDGNAAGSAPPAVISAQQFAQIKTKMSEANVSDETFCKAMGINSLEQLPAERFSNAMTRLQAKIAEAAKQPILEDEILY